jgi:hypothetical protein
MVYIDFILGAQGCFVLKEILDACVVALGWLVECDKGSSDIQQFSYILELL